MPIYYYYFFKNVGWQQLLIFLCYDRLYSINYIKQVWISSKRTRFSWPHPPNKSLKPCGFLFVWQLGSYVLTFGLPKVDFLALSLKFSLAYGWILLQSIPPMGKCNPPHIYHMYTNQNHFWPITSWTCVLILQMWGERTGII